MVPPGAAPTSGADPDRRTLGPPSGSADAGLSQEARDASRHQARSVSATLQAWAMQPPGANGGSASKTSAMEPTP